MRPNPRYVPRDGAWATGCHLDIQITTADFDATPRRELAMDVIKSF
jgi:hypothetical protein